ncbi:hypothetical protein POM88_008904 [Heracleum sosnowskyi]|uniref:Uncharacterized protein n=1 Tax=Heracleum sosnowskyi TaxID=360622 RepID=A0AAD8JAD9_9APIA|nr:hypothetical protein POM88_008904 [Heracleum sosnowskyi]
MDFIVFHCPLVAILIKLKWDSWAVRKRRKDGLAIKFRKGRQSTTWAAAIEFSSNTLLTASTSAESYSSDLDTEAVIEAGIIGPLVQLLGNAELEIKKEASWAVLNAASGGTHEQVK